MAFEWKDRYKLDIPEIDKQHRRLFEIGARVYDLALTDDSFDHYDDIIALLSELLDYTEYHFGFEEELMKKYNYSGLDSQLKEHKFYTDKIRSIAKTEIDDDQKKTIIELVDFLSEWIGSHIMFSDRKYAVELKEKGL